MVGSRPRACVGFYEKCGKSAKAPLLSKGAFIWIAVRIKGGAMASAAFATGCKDIPKQLPYLCSCLAFFERLIDFLNLGVDAAI